GPPFHLAFPESFLFRKGTCPLIVATTQPKGKQRKGPEQQVEYPCCPGPFVFRRDPQNCPSDYYGSMAAVRGLPMVSTFPLRAGLKSGRETSLPGTKVRR